MPHVCPPFKTQWDGWLSDRPTPTHADKKASLLSPAPGKRRGCWALRFRGADRSGKPSRHARVSCNESAEGGPDPGPPGHDAGRRGGQLLDHLPGEQHLFCWVRASVLRVGGHPALTKGGARKATRAANKHWNAGNQSWGRVHGTPMKREVHVGRAVDSTSPRCSPL